mmetsp:Transcript_56817/g.138292  ORF Transcript_56817/g.138292 Transcript_56817/m.138292 type:complete len:780 (-) Transcript_56817:194-2533(-)
MSGGDPSSTKKFMIDMVDEMGMDMEDVEDYDNDDQLQVRGSGSGGSRRPRRHNFGVYHDEEQDNSSTGSDSNSSYEGDVQYHDQLPSVEAIHNAVRMNAAAVLKKQTFAVRNGGGDGGGSRSGTSTRSYGTQQQATRRCVPCLGVNRKVVIAFIAVVVVVVGVWVVATTSYSTSNNRTIQYAISTVTSDEVGVKISSPNAFEDISSPQSKALRWMLYDDVMKLPLPQNSYDPFVQRYVIAVMMFALVGDNDDISSNSKVRQMYQVLSGSHECTWNGEFRRDDDDHSIGATELGILCEDDGDSNIHHEGDALSSSSSMTVTGIAMPSSGLSGELPPELSLLSHLTQLVLDNNEIRFSSTTTTNVAYNNYQYALPVISSLTYLSLAHNALVGTIPDDSYFEHMARLTTLSFSENSLQGFLPSSMATLTELKVLALDGNDLTGGISDIIDASNNGITNLQELYLAYNSFEDTLSNDSFKKLSHLKVLDLKSNKISGPLPDAIWSLTNLEVLDVHHNAFDGHINDVVKPGHKLKYMDVSENLLDKGLPPSMRHLTELTHLDLSYNRFDQLLPGPNENGDTSFIFKNMTKMSTLLLTDNDMFGPQGIPHWVSHMKDLKRLSFRLTSRIGPIPTFLGELTKLELLDLDWNQLGGTIPTQLGQLTRLKYLMLNRNKLTGEIPPEVSSGLNRLKVFTVDNNDFTGTLDTCLGGMIHMVADCGDPDDGCPDCDSDTKEIACPCCTKCCFDNAMRCNMEDWGTAQAEHEFRGDYPKYGYNFDKVDYIPS